MNQDYLAGKKYKVVATLGLVLVQGQSVRSERAVTAYLNSISGIQRWIYENNPLIKLEVRNLTTGEDISKMFFGYVQWSGTRYGNEVKVAKYG